MKPGEYIGKLIAGLNGGEQGALKRVTGNFLYLSVLNALNILLPLVTLPYILGVVGKANYGIYAYVYTILQYIIIIATYGFNFSATKQISQCRDDVVKVNTIYNAVIISKFMIALVLCVIVMALSRFILKDDIAPYMFLLGLGMVLGDVITPVWLFQGMERMKYMTIVNASSKILFTLLVFVIIRSSEDFYLLILLNSAGYILAGVMSLVLSAKQFKMKLGIVSLGDIAYQLKEGSSVFGSTFGMFLYRNANVLILKQFVPNEVVGVYSAAEKVIKGFQSIVAPAAQALFPHLSQRFKDKQDAENLSLLKKISVPFAVVLVVLSGAVFVFAPLISDILCGVEFRDCVPLIRIMTLVILFGEINYLIGILGLINMNRQNQFFYSVLVTGVFSVLFIITFAGRFGATAAAMSMSFSEMLLTVLCLACLIRIDRKR